MKLRPIRNDADHAEAAREIERMLDNEPAVGSEDDAILDAMITLVDAYERKRWPTGEVDPVDMLHVAISDFGRTQKELADLLGSSARASEILSRKRALTLPMIHKISEAWGLPAASLVRPYELAKSTPRRKPQSAAGRVGKPRPAMTAFPNIPRGEVFAMATKPPPGLKRPQVQRRQKGK